jgi:Tfp pilus assembly protein PilF
VANILLVTDRPTVAADLYRNLLELKPDSPVIHFGLGRALKAAGKPRGAIEQFEKAVAAADNYGTAHYQLALLYRDRGEQNKADYHLDRYRRFKGQQPSHGDPLLHQVQSLNRGSRNLATRAKLALKGGKLDLASQLFEAALTQDPAFAAAHAALVFVYWQLGDAKKAEKHYLEAIRLEPQGVEAYLNYGMLVGSQDRLDEAAEVFTSALAADPASATAHTFLGYIRDRQGRRDDAIAGYRAALALEPNQPRANYLLGELLLADGDETKAAEHFELSVTGGGPGSLWFLEKIADAYREAGRPEAAKSFQERADRLASSAVVQSP